MNATQENPAKWFVSHNGQRYGPYPASLLAEWISIGRVAAEAMVSDGTIWISTSEFMEQNALAAQPLPLAPRQAPESDLSDTVSGSPAISDSAASLREPAADESRPDRDRIVVLGRRRAGKTIYLAELYHKLWKSLNGMTAKAISGEVHSRLMKIHQTLQGGQWPPPTQLGTFQIELELEHAGRKRLMVTLDFAGELFRKAFLEEQADFPGVRDLTNHIDRAAAVLLLVDPSIAGGLDQDAAMDDDFGLVQAVQRIRNWPGGDSVPIVLVLTKMDQYQHLLDQFGGSKGFVRHNFPALVRLMKQIPIFQVSAVQTDKKSDGAVIPRMDSLPVNIDKPLQYCLDMMDKTADAAEEQRLQDQREQYEIRVAHAQQVRERKQNFVLIVSVAILLLGGAIAAALILIYRL